MPKLFLDANVIFAATYSENGGSRAIFELAKIKKLEIVSSGYAINEAKFNLEHKVGVKSLPLFYQLVSLLSHVDKTTHNDKKFNQYDKLINAKDLPILLSAIYQNAEFLITLDRKDFQTDNLKKANLPLSILSPGEFLQQL